jgi:hypothetical protein
MKASTLLGAVAGVVAAAAWAWASPSPAAEPPAKEFAADKGPSQIDVSSYPKEVQDNYAVFGNKCSKCHTLARPINTNLQPPEWRMYVKRMMNKPDSGISSEQGKRIYQFLKFWQEEKDKRARR